MRRQQLRAQNQSQRQQSLYPLPASDPETQLHWELARDPTQRQGSLPLPTSAPEMQQSWTKPEPNGSLMDQAPPAYDAALALPPPTQHHSTDVPSKDPPPYTEHE